MAVFGPEARAIGVKATDAAAPCAKSAEPWVLLATILGSSLAFIDGTVVNVALPVLQMQLNASVLDVQWVIEAYALLLSSLLLVGGSLGDHFGRRRVYLIGISIFAIASVWCGCAPGIRQLIAARALQGLGAALLVPGSLAIIGSSFREAERGRAIGTWSGFSAITAAIGPVLGGWLVEHISWRAVFFINLPIALVVIAICLRHVPESFSPEKARLDWPGASLIATGLGALVYGLIESPRLGFANPAVCSALIAAMVLLALFLVVEARRPHPMLPLALFRSRNFSGANLLTLLLYSALSATMFFLPLNLIQVQHYSPTNAGAALLPMILIIFLLSRWSGGLVTRCGAKIPLVVGPLIAAAGLALFLLPGVGGSYWTTFFPAVATLGLGMAVSVAPLTTTVMNSVAADFVGVASGINNVAARAAGLLAIAVLGIVMLQSFERAFRRDVLNLRLPAETQAAVFSQRTKLAAIELPTAISAPAREALERAVADSFLHGFRTIMAIAGALAVASALSAAIFIGPGGKPNVVQATPSEASS